MAEEFLKETVPHARHIRITKVSSGISNSTQAGAGACRLYTGDPRVCAVSLLKCVIAVLITVPLRFLIASLIRKIPLVNRICEGNSSSWCGHNSSSISRSFDCALIEAITAFDQFFVSSERQTHRQRIFAREESHVSTLAAEISCVAGSSGSIALK
jgi:hypothetical protein